MNQTEPKMSKRKRKKEEEQPNKKFFAVRFTRTVDTYVYVEAFDKKEAARKAETETYPPLETVGHSVWSLVETDGPYDTKDEAFDKH